MSFGSRIPAARPSRRVLTLPRILIAAVAVALLWYFHEPLLSVVGTYLNNGEAPRKADAIVVLAGGWRGERIVAAAGLKEQGYAPVVVVSGASTLYGQNECPLAIGMIRGMGRSTDGYVCADAQTESTQSESVALIEFLRAHGMKSVLVVSCDTHMRRASRFWRKTAPDIKMTFVAAVSPNFDLKRWWVTREGRKAVMMEWQKMVTSFFGI